MNPVTWIGRIVCLVVLLLTDSAFAGDYVLVPLPKAYPDRSDFEGELSEPLKDPKVCALYLQNLRYFAKRDLPMSCGQPVAPSLSSMIRPVEWENLDPEKYPDLFKELVTKVFSSGHSEEKDFSSAANLSPWRERVRKGLMVFRRARLELKGDIALPPLYKPVQRVFQVVQFGFDVTDQVNPDQHWHCEQDTRRAMPAEHENELRLFATSQDLHELYGDMSDLQTGYQYYFNLWLMNGQAYGEQYDAKGAVLLSEVRSGAFVRACLFHYKKSRLRTIPSAL